MSVAATAPRPSSGTQPRPGSRALLYGSGGMAVVFALLVIVFGWHVGAGTADPTQAAAGMGSGAAVVNGSVLVFREGLECILVLAAVTAGLRGTRGVHRRPIAVGGVVGFGATLATWFAIVALIGAIGGDTLTVQAATGIPAIVVLLIVMNWFLHKIYWSGWIALHNRRRRSAVSAAPDAGVRRTLIGLGLIGFTSVYREGFEIVVFLQALRERFGNGVVAKGAAIGLLLTLVVGVLTFALHERLPYKKMLVATGGLLVLVLFVMVGEQVNEMQLAGWISTTPIGSLSAPDWAGRWLSVFANWETVGGQALALGIVIGSYVAARHRPRRRSATSRDRRAAADSSPARV